MNIFPCKKLVTYWDRVYQPGVSKRAKEYWKFSVSDYEILHTDENSNIIRCALINRDVNTHYASVENTLLNKYIPLNAINADNIKTIIKERLSIFVETGNYADANGVYHQNINLDQQKSYIYSFIQALIEYLDIAVDTYRSMTTQEYIDNLRKNLQRGSLNIEDFRN